MLSSSEAKIRVSGNTLTKEEQQELLQAFLPACQPQEGSPSNTFTASELDDLKRALPSIQIGPRTSTKPEVKDSHSKNTIDICDLNQWTPPPQIEEEDGVQKIEVSPQDGSAETDQDEEETHQLSPQEEALDWYGVPRFHPEVSLSKAFREKVRAGEFTTPTNGVCPGRLQCNLVVLPQGQVAFDFLLFCQRNPKACPLIDVCDVGSPYAPGVAQGADLRTDVPK
jgi:hypothetical protein